MTVPLGRLVALQNDRAPNELTFRLGLEAIEPATGRLLDSAGEYAGDGIAFSPGDVLFGKLRPYLRKVWGANRRGSAVGDFHVYRPDEVRLTSRFLAYFLLSEPFTSQVSASVYGAKMPRASWDFIRTIGVPLPSLRTQRGVANYLDRETAQIDTLIAKQERLIATLRERRDATWSRTVSSLMDEFEVVPLRRVVDSIADGPFGSSLTSKHYVDSGARVIRLGNIGIDEFLPRDEAYISLDYYRDLQAHRVDAGDVVVAGLGDDSKPLGRATVIPDVGPAIVKADCYRVRTTAHVLPTYVAWILSSPPLREQFQLLSRGSTRSRLNTTVVMEARIPIVPLADQQSVVDQSRAVMRKIDTLIAKAERFIELSKERRAALITAAVTGQIEVPEV